VVIPVIRAVLVPDRFARHDEDCQASGRQFRQQSPELAERERAMFEGVIRNNNISPLVFDFGRRSDKALPLPLLRQD
jgi:hypothetical protein